MADLKALCIDAGFSKVQTYIASGNILLESDHSEAQIKVILESRLKAYAGREVNVVVRSVAEMKGVLEHNPYAGEAPNRTAAIFLNEPPAPSALIDVAGRVEEKIALGKREIYVYYPGGMGTSKLNIKAARDGTARNLNTVAKLAELGEKMTQR